MNWNYNSLIGLMTASLVVISYVVFYDSIYDGNYKGHSSLRGEIAFQNDNNNSDNNDFDYVPDENLPDVPKEVQEERDKTYVPYDESHAEYLRDTRMPNINIHHNYLMEDHPLQEKPLQEEPIP